MPILTSPTGWAAHYSSWRHMQEAIGVAAFATFIFVYFYLSETKYTCNLP